MIWFEEAACRGTGPSLFFTEESEERAKAVCAGCPVSAECLAYAVDTKQADGVWGGLNEKQRYGAVLPNSRTERLDMITYTTNARSTGATCSAGRTSTGWGVLCKTHGHTASAPSRTVAEYAVSRPEEWCPGCALLG